MLLTTACWLFVVAHFSLLGNFFSFSHCILLLQLFFYPLFLITYFPTCLLEPSWLPQRLEYCCLGLVFLNWTTLEVHLLWPQRASSWNKSNNYPWKYTFILWHIHSFDIAMPFLILAFLFWYRCYFDIDVFPIWYVFLISNRISLMFGIYSSLQFQQSLPFEVAFFTLSNNWRSYDLVLCDENIWLQNFLWLVVRPLTILRCHSFGLPAMFILPSFPLVYLEIIMMYHNLF